MHIILAWEICPRWQNSDRNHSGNPGAVHSVTYDYADTRFSSETTDSWLDNFDLVSAYVEYLNRELDKCVLWLLWQFQAKPREMAKYLGCNVRLVYAAIQRIKKVTRAKQSQENTQSRVS